MVQRKGKGTEKSPHQVVIVGAGSAGVGMAVTLQHAGVKDVVLLERHGVGASFSRWPAEMRLITPSFPTNSIGMLDLNSIAIGTSPGFSLKIEHPSGKEYATYLQAVAQHFQLRVRSEVNVSEIVPREDSFEVQTNEGELYARYVIWAAGEFQYPLLRSFPGAELCKHAALVSSWKKYTTADDVLIIGGYESGIDAAIHLARSGKKVMVLDRGAPWHSEDSDPSVSLSPFTLERLKEPEVASRVKLASHAEVAEVKRWGQGYEVRTTNGKAFRSACSPVLATGFQGSMSLIRDLFETREDGYPLLNDQDESTITPNLFLSGPMVRHDEHVFCFIYKFRQRFAVIAKAIANRLQLPAEELETYRQWGMYLDDLSCCGEECVC